MAPRKHSLKIPFVCVCVCVCVHVCTRVHAQAHVPSLGRREGDQGLQAILLEFGNSLSQVAAPLCSQMPQRNSGSLGQSGPHGLLAQPIPGCHHVKHQITVPRELGLSRAPGVPCVGPADGQDGSASRSDGLESLGHQMAGPRGAENMNLSAPTVGR